jgi:hypothetical protein
MKSAFLLSVMLVLLASCVYNDVPHPATPDKLIGFWVMTSLDFNGVNSSHYVDGLNTANILGFSDATNVGRAYQFGTWTRDGSELTIKWEFEGSKSYNIVTLTDETLAVEFTSRHGDTDNYRGWLDQFFPGPDPVTIRETYTRNPSE